MFEDDTGPVLEVKWESIKGIFSHDKHFRRLASLYKKQSNISIEASPLPGGWEQALRGFETLGFQWSGNDFSGRGVILYCPKCRSATLIQIYRADAKDTYAMIEKLLASLKDHPLNSRMVWAVFDIRAVLPDTFRLDKHYFKPGEYKISFTNGRMRVTLHRWSPAAVLLSERNLGQFAQMAADIPFSTMQDTLKDGEHQLEWKLDPSSLSAWSQLKRRVRRKPMLIGFRIWHEDEKNRILGIRLEGKGISPLPELETIVSSYEST
jgi:hypothetical protein